MSEDSTKVLETFHRLQEKVEGELNEDYELEFFRFGENAQKMGVDDSLDFSDRYTNYEALFKELNNRFENRNVGALVLASDGIYNRGLNPTSGVGDLAYPVYTLAYGDTNQRRDLILQNAIHNKLAFLGNQFPIRAEYKAMKVKGGQFKIDLYHEGKLIDSQAISIEDQNQAGSVDFLVEAKKSGLQQYKVVIAGLEDEKSVQNNYQNVFIDVLDSRQKVLFLYRAPHPDIAAIQSAISSNENYQIVLKKFDEFAESINAYDLIILHQLISGNGNEVDPLLSQIQEKKKPMLIVLNEQSNWSKLNSLETAIEFSNPLQSSNEVFPLCNEAFPLFKLNEEQLTALSSYPPLRVPQVGMKLKDQSYALLNQQIGTVPTNAPLLAFRESGKSKVGLMMGESWWKWRVSNYLSYGDHKFFDQIIAKLIQYLSVKSDKSYFRISHEKEFLENDKIRFDLQLFNKSYDPINEPDAQILIEDEEGNQYDYQFNRSNNAYYLDVTGLGVGNYTYTAKTTLGNEAFETKGNFRIIEILVEGSQLVANHNLLFQLSEKSAGKVYRDFDLSLLKEELAQRGDISSISYNQEEVEDVINLRWIFYILLGLLAIEWFIRKYNGAY